MKIYKVIEDGVEYTVEEYSYYKTWRINTGLHRENGPAIEFGTGTSFWFKNNKRHKENGPAGIHSDGTEEYWLNGKPYLNIKSNEHWIEFQKELIIKEIIE